MIRLVVLCTVPMPRFSWNVSFSGAIPIRNLVEAVSRLICFSALPIVSSIGLHRRPAILQVMV
jgi:hypothetical protein